MANVISAACLDGILLNGALHKNPINLQIASLKVTKGNSLQLQLSDTIHMTQPFDIIVEDPRALCLFAVVRLGSYELKSVENRNEESPEKYTFHNIQFTGIIRDIPKIIGNPVLIQKKYESNVVPMMNDIDEKRKSREQQLSFYFNRDTAKFKLKRTTLLQQKHHHKERLIVLLNEKTEIEKKIDELQETITNFNASLEKLTKKTAECQQKIDYYSELS